MKPNEFIANATTPDAWFKKSVALSRSGQLLWREVISQLFGYDYWQDHMQGAHLFYSLALETALKGSILQTTPEKFKFEPSMTGSMEILSIRLKQFGTNSGDGHNLEKLAEIVGVINQNADLERRKVLRYASECILWRTRYPVPMAATSEQPKTNHWYTDSGKHFFGEVIPIIKSLLPSEYASDVTTLSEESARRNGSR